MILSWVDARRTPSGGSGWIISVGWACLVIHPRLHELQSWGYGRPSDIKADRIYFLCPSVLRSYIHSSLFLFFLFALFVFAVLMCKCSRNTPAWDPHCPFAAHYTFTVSVCLDLLKSYEFYSSVIIDILVPTASWF